MDATLDFPFVETMPKRERSKVRTLWDRMIEVHEISKTHGQHWPVHVAAEALGISRQRIHQLINDGRFTPLVVNGRNYISMASIQAYAESERSMGRGVKPSKLTWQKCVELACEELK